MLKNLHRVYFHQCSHLCCVSRPHFRDRIECRREAHKYEYLNKYDFLQLRTSATQQLTGLYRL